MKSTSHRVAILLTSVVLGLSTEVARSQEFEAWQGKPVVHEGEGGTKQVVDGIDVWDRGSPPRKFVIIGYIHDRRLKTGLIGKIKMSHLNSDVAKIAKQAGGDAVIVVSSDVDTVGAVGGGFGSTNASAQAVGNSAYGHSNTSSFGFAGSVRKQESEFAVLKYLPDEPAAPPESSPAPTPK